MKKAEAKFAKFPNSPELSLESIFAILVLAIKN